MRILISAYACQPDCGSEPGVGWGVYQATRSLGEVSVITRVENKVAIENFLDANPSSGSLSDFIFLCLGIIEERLINIPKIGRNLHYLQWQRTLRAFLVRNCPYEIVHHVSYVRCWMPFGVSGAASKVVIGPVGAIERTPVDFLKYHSRLSRFSEWLRSSVLDWFSNSERLISDLKSASVTIPITYDTQTYFKGVGCKNIEEPLSECYLSRADLTTASQRMASHSRKFKLISLGRLIGWKGHAFVIELIAKLKKLDIHYDIVGAGANFRHLQSLATSLGVSDRVRFLGQIPRAEALRCLSEAQVFMHVSHHDAGGWACLEAMAHGLPVICLDVGGPAAQITDETGLRLPANEGAKVCLDLAKVFLQRLMVDPVHWSELSHAGRRRVETVYVWSAYTDRIQSIYESLGQAPDELVPKKS